MYKISQEDIERVRDLSDIVDVISQYVQLISKGNNFLDYVLFIMKKHPLLALLIKNRYFTVLVVGKEEMFFLL